MSQWDMMVKQTHSKTLEFTVLAILSVTMFSRLWTQMAHQPITHIQQQLNTFRHVDMVEDDLQKFTVSTRLAEKGHWSDFERSDGCWWSQDGLQVWEFHKLLLIYLHFHHITTTSRVYRERVHKEKASSERRLWGGKKPCWWIWIWSQVKLHSWYPLLCRKGWVRQWD